MPHVATPQLVSSSRRRRGVRLGTLALALLATAATVLAVEADDNLPPSSATEIWSPVPRVVQAPPGGVPSDAVVLFDGRNLAAWESSGKSGHPARWKVEAGAFVVAPGTGNIQTKQGFGDIQLHIEWRTPAEVTGFSQGRGNSGIFFMGLYELQVLDSYNNPTYVNGQAGAIYKQHIPLVNASRKPGAWQTYDVIWQAPRFGADGKLARPAYATVLQNGVLVQNHVAVTGPTTHRGVLPYKAHAPKLPLMLQDHKNPVAYRNIWVRELQLPE